MAVRGHVDTQRLISTLVGVFLVHPRGIIFCSTDYKGGKIAISMGTHFRHLDDESLLHQIQERKHGAFAELTRRHSKRFYCIAYRLLFNKDDAEDIVQEAFLKLWERPEIWNRRNQAKFTTWFYRIVTNLCLDQNKKKKPFTLTEDMQCADNQPGQDAVLDYKQKQALLDRFIQELPERQQLALNLCFYEGLSNKDAAEIIRVEVKAVQSLIMRAKKTLKEKVKHAVSFEGYNGS